MSIYKQAQSSNWWIKVYVRGKPMRVSSGTADRKVAENIERTLRMGQGGNAPVDALHKLLDAICGAEDRHKNDLPIENVFAMYQTYLKRVKKIIAPSTLASRSRVAARLTEWVKEVYPSAFTAERVDRACAVAYAESLMTEKPRRRSKKRSFCLKDKSRQNIINDLASIWEGLMRSTDSIKANPWKLVRPDVHDSESGQPFTGEQVTAVLGAADAAGHGWGLACRIALYTGLRYGDVATLEWSDVDLDKAVIKTTPNKTARHKVVVEVPIAKPLLEAFKQQTDRTGEVLPAMALYYPEQYLPFKFRKVLELAKIEGRYTFHSFRHTFRTRLAEAGVSDEIAKRLGGWTNDKMADHYDHSKRIEELRAAVAKI
jgi:integrase